MKTKKLLERLLEQGTQERLLLFGARWVEFPGGSTIPDDGSPLKIEGVGKRMRSVVLGRVVRELEGVCLARGTPLAYLDHLPCMGDLVEVDSVVGTDKVMGIDIRVPMFVMEVLAVEKPIPSGTRYPGEKG